MSIDMCAYNAGALSTCPSCGNPVMEGELYCMNCGIQLSQPASVESPVVGSCPMCGAAIHEGEYFCTSCGADQRKGGGTVPVSVFVAPEPGPIATNVQGSFGGGAAPIIDPIPSGTGTQLIDSGDPWNLGPAPTPAPAPEPDPWNITQVPSFEPEPWNNVTPPVQEVGDVWQGGYAQPPAPQPPVSGGTDSSSDDDDDPTIVSKLITLTREEARSGCRKQIQAHNQLIEVDIPAGVDATTKLDVPGMGNFDEQTGQPGPLRLSFYLI